MGAGGALEHPVVLYSGELYAGYLQPRLKFTHVLVLSLCARDYLKEELLIIELHYLKPPAGKKV